jgi:hypothetical protein
MNGAPAEALRETLQDPALGLEAQVCLSLSVCVAVADLKFCE